MSEQAGEQPFGEFPFSRIRRHDIPKTHPVTRAVIDNIARAIEDPRPADVDEQGVVIALAIAAQCVQAVWDLETRIVDLERRLGD